MTTSYDFMEVLQPGADADPTSTIRKLNKFQSRLAKALDDLSHRTYPPEARKQFTKTFSTGDLEKLLGVPESTLRSKTFNDRGPQPGRLGNGRRIYTLNQVNEMRHFLAAERPAEALKFLPNRREGEKAQIIAAVNFKGGSSKTTTSIHLAHFLALQGYRVLAVDLDPQASMTNVFGLFPDRDVDDDDTIYSAIRYGGDRRPIEDIIRPTYFRGIDLIPSNLIVQEFEFETPQALAFKEHDAYGYFYQRLGRAFSEIEHRYDVIVIDTPPTLGYLTLSALFASTGLIITVHPAMMDVASCSQFLRMMSATADVLTEKGGEFRHDFVRILITRYNPNDQPQKEISGMLRHLFSEDVLVNEALESTAIAAAGIAKNTLYETDIGQVGRDAFKRAIESIDAVNHEILNLIHQTWGR